MSPGLIKDFILFLAGVIVFIAIFFVLFPVVTLIVLITYFSVLFVLAVGAGLKYIGFIK